MRAQEEELFDSWIRDRPEWVRRLRDGGYLTSRAGEALGRTRADARRLFDDFLVRITNLSANQDVIAWKYQKFHVPRIRRGLHRKSREEAARFSRLAKAAAQLAVRSIDVEPQALQLRVRACGPNLQRDGVCAQYAYAIAPGIRHSVSIRFTRNRGETISQKRIGDLTSRTGREAMRLVKAIGAEKKSLDEMRAALTGNKQAQRDSNKRVIAFNEKVKRLREPQTERDGLKAEARAIGRSLDGYRSRPRASPTPARRGIWTPPSKWPSAPR
jgi:hypothetical protein